MEKGKRNRFNPNIAIPPGDTLQELLEAKHMTQKDLAMRTNRPVKTINEIIKGKAAIMPETAIQFERVLDVPASFWNNLESNYREKLCYIAEQKKIAQEEEWARQFPIKKLQERHWISKSENTTEELLSFFGVANSAAWNNVWRGVHAAFTYRKSDKINTDVFALASWLRRGEIIAAKKDISDFSREKLLRILPQLKALSLKKVRDLQAIGAKLLADCGVILIFVQELPNMPISGVYRRLPDGKRVIQLSLRYKTNDQIWFSLAHEIGHMVLHKKYDFTYANISKEEKDKLEEEANKFAADFFIEPEKYAEFKTGKITESRFRQFAEETGIAPGILVGRWQHENKIFNRFNNLKVKLQWG